MSADEARQFADDGAGRRAAARFALTTAARSNISAARISTVRWATSCRVKQKDGDEFTYLLDPDTYLEIKVDETRRIRGAQQTTETELGDYEKIAGVYYPMSVESWQQGSPNQRQRVLIATGQANAPVDAAYFAEPGGPAPLAKTSPEPPDASMKPQGKPGTKKAGPASKQPPASPATPPKGSK